MMISVLQWNIWYKEDIRNIVTFLQTNTADVICLQEMTINYPDQSVNDTPKFIAEQLGYNYYYKEIPIESADGNRLIIANGIFTHFPIKDQRFVWINEPRHAGGYDDEYRAYVEVDIAVGKKLIKVGTTHMSYTHKFEPTINKKSETDKLVNEFRNLNTPLIFTGDLNAAPDSYTLESVQKYLQHLGPDFSHKSWTTKPFSYNGFKETDLNWRLDYIFGSKGLIAELSQVLTTDYSDHLPVLAKINI